MIVEKISINQSVFNEYANDPPVLLKDGEVIGELTTNTTYNYEAVDPISLGKDCGWTDEEEE